MQLVINTNGSYLRKEGNCFRVRNEDKQFDVSVKKVDSILLTREFHPACAKASVGR